jgi:hypothetical protein
MSRIVPILLALAVAGVAGFFLFGRGGAGTGLGDIGTVTPGQITSSAPYTGAPLTKPYSNSAFGFSLSMPEGFSAQELEKNADGASTILIQNKSGEGIQILVTPFPEDTKVLTADQIRQDIPDMQVRQPEEVAIGAQYKGVAFLSDNEAFENASREVWFVFRGNLYQISTYERLDTLLKAIFATWKFF